MEKYNIKDCVPSDVIQLYNIQEGTNYTKKIIEDMIVNDRMIFLKAVINKKIIGYVSLEILIDEGEIHSVMVIDEYKNQGIAKELIKTAMNRVNLKKIFLEVNENNTKAINLYKGLGFMPISKRQKYYGDQDAIIMEITLLL
ncbi:MAG: ribosomal protein S18-alanine N-acetyltransferase [Firmicutes bacterium]|nr:ribosomal protein S18-alanine N-acetyltransferase [Bacillota bacterium]